ncbi:ferredoxin reductase [Nocardioides sp. Kera G14]|uniref:ferredoxin reductase n=1 Tax=Nocardioides sp. Kera G14 TaxID=2884264 RepID=UPI001D10CE7A|nr:ferredoxin reductase [Nocardioides sp. Kera G14]UDY23253.1 ferredoxin reductase [Nocardioides sp. Kera G14]
MSTWISERAGQVAALLATPLVPDDYLDLFHPLRKGAALRARVVEVHPETADAATLLLKPGRDWVGHIPGQYLRIGVDVDGVRHWRAYSLTHGPRRDGLISITVKAVADGKVSPYLVHGTKPGTLVHIEQAQGDFVLPAALTDQKFLFVTAGSGITPVIGMLRNLFPATDAGVVNHHDQLDITLVHLAPSHPDTIFVKNLEALAESGAIRLISWYDDERGTFDIEKLDELVLDLHDRETFACGPTGLLDALSLHHAERGKELHTEQFRTSTVVIGDGGTVTFDGVANAGTAVDVDASTSILDAAEAAGVLMPSGCRMGICFGCVLPLKEGAVRDLRNGDLIVAVPGETDGLNVQTCISAPAGACVIDH